MDNMNIVSKFTGTIFSKLISRWVCKKLECNMRVQFDEIHARVTDENVYISVDGEIEMTREVFLKLLKEAGAI